MHVLAMADVAHMLILYSSVTATLASKIETHRITWVNPKNGKKKEIMTKQMKMLPSILSFRRPWDVLMMNISYAAKTEKSHRICEELKDGEQKR